jgi:hypothetical protein
MNYKTTAILVACVIGSFFIGTIYAAVPFDKPSSPYTQSVLMGDQIFTMTTLTTEEGNVVVEFVTEKSKQLVQGKVFGDLEIIHAFTVQSSDEGMYTLYLNSELFSDSKEHVITVKSGNSTITLDI